MSQLLVVGTPIGNLGDWSPRAQEVLATVGLIACEDTRRTGSLLSKHGIANPGMIVMNEHTERDVIDRVVRTLGEATSVAVVTDAGMPTISDPGAAMVAAVAEAGFEIVVVPGPTAVSAALAVSGFAANRFVFEGFLPRKGAERKRRLNELATEARMIVLYEAPHRIERTMGDLAACLGADRRCAVARELTKLHESVWRGPLGEAVVEVAEPRGEYVVVIDGLDTVTAEVTDAALIVELRTAIGAGKSARDAASEVATTYGIGRRRVYELTHDIERATGVASTIHK